MPTRTIMDKPWLRRHSVALAANALLAVVAGLAGVMAMSDALAGDLDSRAAAAYFLVRAVVVAVAVPALVVAAIVRRRVGSLPVVLLIAGAIQVGDVPVSLLANDPGVAVAALMLAGIHLGTAWAFRRR